MVHVAILDGLVREARTKLEGGRECVGDVDSPDTAP